MPNPDSTCSGQVGENQTRNRPPITTGRVRLGSKKRSVGSVEIDERWRRAEKDETSSNLVGGVRNVANLSLHVIYPSLNVTDLSDFLKNIARFEPKSSDLRRS